MTAIVEARDLSIRVGEKTLVDSVSLAVETGETVALVGPNGAGKSTLLRALSGELSARAGAVMLKSRVLRTYSARELAQHRAALSQSVTVGFPFTVAEVVAMGAGDRRGGGIDALIDAALDEVDLASFRDRPITTLSGGEQQRAQFARILVQLGFGEALHGPGLLLLDEPTSSLDLRHQLDLVAAVRRRTDHGTTVVTVVHDLNLAALMARRVIVLNGGRIAADGPTQSTLTESLMQTVFGVVDSICQVPSANGWCVLPHRAKGVAH